jgi:hypothetical protein
VLAGADALLARCAVHGTRRVELGMAHRGRLAMLATLLNKPPGTLFAKMENGQSDYRVGDVTYHLGETATLTYSQVSPCLQSESLTICDAAWSSSICRGPLVPPDTSKGVQSSRPSLSRDGALTVAHCSQQLSTVVVRCPGGVLGSAGRAGS